MKRIEFIAPVSAMRGNLSGNQTLLYPSRDNSAFDSPADKVNYARNYTPRFIGAKRAKDGHTYFAVKTKSAVNTTAATMLAMAAMGAANAYYACLIKDLSFKSRVDAIYASYPAGTYKSLREFVYAQGLYDMFKNKQLLFSLMPAVGSDILELPLENPFHADSAPDGTPPFPADILVKFWNYLAGGQDGETPIKFTIISAGTGVTFEDFTWQELASGAYNNLGVKIGVQPVDDDDNYHVYIGAKRIATADGVYVLDTQGIQANAVYTLID